MATYYVSKKDQMQIMVYHPNTAWLTFTKLLDSTGISSGDIAYIEPGIYRSFNCKHDFSNRQNSNNWRY